MKKNFLFLSMAAMMVVACSDDPVAVESIAIEPSSVAVYQNTEVAPVLQVKFTPENADDKTIVWTSSSQAVSVSDKNEVLVNGEITEDATVTLTATAKSGVTATCTVALRACLEGGYKVVDLKEVGLQILDRNLGAEEVFNGSYKDMNVNSIGDFYQYGKNEPVGTVEAVNKNWTADWSTESEGFKDWTVAENTPCPKGWRLPTADEMKKIVNASFWDWDFVDFGMMTEDELYAAKDFQKKTLIPYSGAWQAKEGTPTRYLDGAAMLWSAGVENGKVTTYEDNNWVVKGNREPNYAMPVRCVRSAE